MRRIIILATLLTTSCMSSNSESPPNAAQINVTYTPSFAEIPNPERGFYKWLDEASIDNYANEGYNLAYLRENLHEYLSTDLPPSYLERLSNRFQLARRAGIKLILRFTYNEGENYPNPAPDPTLKQVLRHIEQLAPVIQSNKDVISWIEAGFVGAWGEWHTSASGLDTPENKAVIRDALYRHFPQDRFILFRYPADFTRWYPQPLTEAQAFDVSNQARTGHHNDCFLASEDDMGTYYDNGSSNNEEWKAYIAQMGRFIPISGETCAPNPPRSDCPSALYEMSLLHWSAINEEWHPAVIQGWKDQGCYTEIRQRLGYRLTLIESEFTPTVQAGGPLKIQVKLKNTGFASPMLARPLYLVLAGRHGVSSFPIPVDPRRWEAGQQHTLSATMTLPADLPPGTYQLALWLPDPAPSLQSDPRYAIRFANENVWDTEHGWNVLGHLVVQKRTTT